MAQRKADLGAKDRLVDPLAGLQPGRVDGLAGPLDLAVKGGFGLEGFGPPVAQSPVRFREGGAVAVSTEIGGGDRIEPQCSDE